jgi:hypothetical protein
MANGGIIGPVNDPQRGDLTTTFTSSGTYTSPGFGPGQADYLVVAGGGWRWRIIWTRMELVEVEQEVRTSFPGGTKLTVPASPISVTVGAGGAGGPGPSNTSGSAGNPSIFSTITSQEVVVVEFIMELFQVVVVDQEVEEVEVDLLVQEIHLQQVLHKEIQEE